VNGFGSIDGTQACGCLYPHMVVVAAKTMTGEREVVVQCNRPSGHDGNHVHSTAKQARLYEWTPSILVKGK
jgi:hypothetical protein